MNYLNYMLALSKLERKSKKANSALSKIIAEARRSGGEKNAQDTYGCPEHIDVMLIEEEISKLKTDYLTGKANEMCLPLPTIDDKNGCWEKGNLTERWILTNKGITEIRKLIRTERKENLEITSRWVYILFGLIGAITGLIAIYKK